MPTLQLRVAPLQNPERHAALAQALTDLTARWFIGGQATAHPTALLQIHITAGTNTEAEKARFVAQAFAELQRQLGAGQPLAPASYVTVRGLPATDWG